MKNKWGCAGCLRLLPGILIGVAVVAVLAAQSRQSPPAAQPTPVPTRSITITSTPALFDLSAGIPGFDQAGPPLDTAAYLLRAYHYTAAPRISLTLMVSAPGFTRHEYTQFPVDHTTRNLLGISVESGFRDDVALGDAVLTRRYESLAFDFAHQGSHFSGELSFTTGDPDQPLLDQALLALVAAITGQPLPGSSVTAPSASPRFRPGNCATAVAAGLTAQEAGQWPHLDRDRDGVACYGD